jgi:uncharacterized RDD family membrane protein YckC
MTKRPGLIVPAIILGVALLIVALVYFVDSASALPSFFPGHQSGSAHHHVKHGIAAGLLGVACLVFAWFQTGPSTTPGRPASRTP